MLRQPCVGYWCHESCESQALMLSFSPSFLTDEQELICAVAEQQDGSNPASNYQAKRTSVTPCPVEGSDVGGTADGTEPTSDNDSAKLASDNDKVGSTKGSTAEVDAWVDDLFSDDTRESVGLNAGDTGQY